MRVCLVTLCIGRFYLDQYNRLFRSSQEAYAKRCGYDFKVIEDYIGEHKHPHLISFNKILVCDYAWKTTYDFLIFIDADILIHPNAPPLHAQYAFGDKIGVVNESQPTLQARHEYQKHQGFEITASEYYKQKSDHTIETDHIINTGVLVIQPHKHKDILRDIYEKYHSRQINNKNGFHYEQSVIGYELQTRNIHLFMDFQWNAIWSNHKYYYNVIKGKRLGLEEFFKKNYFTHLAGKCDYNIIPFLQDQVKNETTIIPTIHKPS